MLAQQLLAGKRGNGLATARQLLANCKAEGAGGASAEEAGNEGKLTGKPESNARQMTRENEENAS